MILLSTAVAHDLIEALAAEAAVKVQDVARLSRALGRAMAVTAGSAAGAAATSANSEAIVARVLLVYISKVQVIDLQRRKDCQEWKEVREGSRTSESKNFCFAIFTYTSEKSSLYHLCIHIEFAPSKCQG